MSARGRLPLLRWLSSPTSRLTREGRARRRYNCGKQGEWDERAEAALALLSEHAADWRSAATGHPELADFGAGNERLRSLLRSRFGPEVGYRPFDLHPQFPTTERLDVAREMPAGSFDLVFCLGLLEYLPSIPDFARRLKTVCRFALVSYVTSDSPVAISPELRRQHGWTTHLTGAEVEAAFEDAGFRSLGSGSSDGEATTLWLWAAPSTANAAEPPSLGR